MKRTVPMLAALAWLVACSTAAKNAPSDAPDGSATGDSAASPEDAGGEGGGATTCGPAPWVSLSLIVEAASASAPDGGGSPVEGATLTNTLCPGLSRTSGADGIISAQVTKDAPFFSRFTAPNFANTLIAEMKFGADRAGIVATLPPKIFTALIPGFDDTKAAILVGIMQDGGVAGCATLDGVARSVVDHPEAQLIYLTDEAIPQPSNGTTTTTSGRAVVMGIAPGAVVSLQATKTGCSVTFAKDPYTGRVSTEAGALSLVPGYLK